MSGDLAGDIASLSDEDAVAALAFILDLEDGTTEDMRELEAVQGHLPEAFEQTPDIGEFGAPDQNASPGDLARATLAYLAEHEPGGLVGEAVRRRRPVGKRDPLSLAVGGLIVLALKSEVQLKRTSTGKWTFSYHLKPTKDSSLVAVFTKLWGIYGGGRSQ